MHPTGLPLLLASLLLGFGAVVTLLVATASQNRRVIAITLKGTMVWALGYGAILLATSMTSNDRLLGHGERKAFCGFYLDCHVGATVLQTDRAHRLLLGDSTVTAHGQFVLVDFLIDNDAMTRPLSLDGVRFVVAGSNGGAYVRRTDLEFEINRPMDRPPTRDTSVKAQQTLRQTLVFEGDGNLDDLRLHVSAGNAIERLLELFLIGDEDSLLHGRKYHRL